MTFKWGGLAIIVIFICTAGIQAQTDESAGAVMSDDAVEKTNENSSSPANSITYKPMGYGDVEVGQIASGYYRRATIPLEQIAHVWQERALAWMGFDARIKERLDIKLALGGAIAYSTPQLASEPQTIQTRQLFFVKMANAAYSFGNWENLALQAQIGYFPYKYNPDARNLGEILFRSNAYPLLIYSDFDYPMADILGGRFNLQYKIPDRFINFENDLLLHSETYTVPVQNWTLSDVFSVNCLKALTIGLGASYQGILSVYQGQYGTQWTDLYFNTKKNPYYLKDSTGADSALFDWKALKIMGRLSFDFKKFIPANIFGKNDLILYSETDIIGTRNYPQYYTNMKDRIFYMVGFNLPGFKVIDVINTEFEYCRDTTAFSDEGMSAGYQPLIFPVPLNAASTTQIKRNPLRWSVYIKKSVLDGHMSFILQCARDHKKLNFYYFLRSRMSFMETLPATSDWWWTFKTEFTF